MAYLLDTDVFIQAKNRHYGFQFVPAFWDWLAAEHGAGHIFSVQRVKDELRPDHVLWPWALAQPPGFFLAVDAGTTAAMPTVSAWAAGEARFTAAARNDFFAKADYYLVAQALAHGHTVVTHEGPAPTATTRIAIPDACAGVGVTCTNIFEVLRNSGARFVLGGP